MFSSNKRKEPLLHREKEEKWCSASPGVGIPWTEDFKVGKKPSGPFSTPRAELRDSHQAPVIFLPT